MLVMKLHLACSARGCRCSIHRSVLLILINLHWNVCYSSFNVWLNFIWLFHSHDSNFLQSFHAWLHGLANLVCCTWFKLRCLAAFFVELYAFLFNQHKTFYDNHRQNDNQEMTAVAINSWAMISTFLKLSYDKLVLPEVLGQL